MKTRRCDSLYRRTTDKGWRPGLRRAAFVLGSLFFSAVVSTNALADEPETVPSAQPVDAATRQLMAANGLFQRGLFKLAAQEYARFLQEHPGHEQLPAARYGLAICDYRLGLFHDAIPLLNDVAADKRFEPKDEVLSLLGYCELSEKQYDRALGHFDQLLKDYPQSKQRDQALLFRAQAFYLGDRAKESAEACESFLSSHPDSADRATALYFLGLSRKSLGQNDAAITALGELAAKFPESTYRFDAVLLMGQILEAEGKPEAAIEQYRQLVKISGASRLSDAHYSLGLALYGAGKLNEAIAELSTVVRDLPASAVTQPAKLQLGLAELAAGQIADARNLLEQVAKEDPGRAAEARYGLAQCDIAAKDYASAKAILDELYHRQPAPANLPQISLYRAVCLMELSRFREANEALDQLIGQSDKTGRSAEALYRSAYCLHKLSRFEESRDRCQEIARLPASGFTAPAAQLDAENLFLMAKYDTAQAAFDALAGQSDDPRRRLLFQLRAAQCDYFSGKYQSAARRLSPIVADPLSGQSPELQPALFLLGDAQLQEGKNHEAAAALKRYIDAARDDTSEAQYKLAVAMIRDGDSARAAPILEALCGGDARSTWVQRALLELGQLRYKAQEASAADPLEKLLGVNPQAEFVAPATYLLGWVRFDTKRYPEAAALWKQVRERFPDHPLEADAAFEEGVALSAAGQKDAAVASLEAFAASHSTAAKAVDARQLAASILTQQGKNAAAATILAEAARDRGASDRLLYDLAWAQRGAKQDEQAVATYRRLLEAHTQSPLVPAAKAEMAELLYAGKKFADAVALLEPLLAVKELEPKIELAASYRLAWCYQKLNQFDKAAAAFRKVAERWPADELAPSALLQAALADADSGRDDAAATELISMLKRYPSHKDAPVALLKLAEVQAAAGDFDASAATEKDFLTHHASDPLVYRAQFGIGWALENQKKYGEARAAYQKVIAATNGETAARAQFQIGETLLADQKYEESIAAFLAVEDVYAYPKWSARALFEAGRAFEQLKQPDQAKQQYNQLVMKYKDAPEAELAQDRLKSLKEGT